MKTAKQFDEAMWDAYAGAEDLACGAAPYYRTIGKWMVIADGAGLSALDQTDMDGDTFYTLTVKLTPAMAVLVLNNLPKDFAPAPYGMTAN